MNELSSFIFIFGWILLTSVSIGYVGSYIGFLFYILFKFKHDELRIKEKYKNELGNFNIFFISKEIKKINIKVQFTIANVIAFVMIFIISLLFLSYGGFLNLFSYSLEINYIWPFIVGLLSIILFFNILIIITGVIFVKRKYSYEINDNDLVQSFNSFVDEWIKINGSNKIAFETLTERKNINFAFNKLQTKLNPMLLKYKRKHPKNYEFWYIEKFRTYLDAINKYVVLFDNFNQLNQMPIKLPELNLFVDFEKIRFLVIHNYVCGINEVKNLTN